MCEFEESNLSTIKDYIYEMDFLFSYKNLKKTR